MSEDSNAKRVVERRARALYHMVRSFVYSNDLAILFVLGGLLAIWWGVGRPVPPGPGSWPLWVWVFGFFSVPGTLCGLWVGGKIADWWDDVRRIALHDIDPVSGDIAGFALTPDAFSDLVVMKNGEVTERNELILHRIHSEVYSEAYEVEDFDHEEMICEVTWMAGASDQDFRKHKNAVGDVKDRLAPLADAYSEIRGSAESMVRESTEFFANWMIDVFAGGDMPTSGGMSNIIGDSVDRGIEDAGFPEPPQISFEEDGEIEDDGFLEDFEDDGGDGDD